MELLDNKKLGENIQLYRKLKGINTIEVAEKLGLKESAYTRYERGEGEITISLVNKIANIIHVNPHELLSKQLQHNINNVENSPHSIVAQNIRDVTTQNAEQNKMLIKVLENVVTMTTKLTELVNKK